MDLIINNINYSNIPDNLKLDIKNLSIYHTNTINNINQNILNNQITIVYNQLLESLDYYNRLLNKLYNINNEHYNLKEYRYGVNKSIDKQYINSINKLINQYITDLDKIFIDNFMIQTSLIKK